MAVAGCDEVGKGAWAGPVSVGVVVLPCANSPAPQTAQPDGVRDSKALTEPVREQLFDQITDWCRAWSVGHALPQECDFLGMSAAQTLAASRALAKLEVEPSFVLVDGRWDFLRASLLLTQSRAETRTVIKGDQISLSIAAASVVAKVTRDRLMRKVSDHFPEFDFASNKGYPSPTHKAALKDRGATPIHRQSWAFMQNLGLAPAG